MNAELILDHAESAAMWLAVAVESPPGSPLKDCAVKQARKQVEAIEELLMFETLDLPCEEVDVEEIAGTGDA